MVAISEHDDQGVRVVDRVLASLGKVPERPPNSSVTERRTLVPNNEPRWPPARWERLPHKAYSLIADPILDPKTGRLSIQSTDLAPKTREFIFQTDLKVPKLVAVSWPENLAPAKGARIPYLVYFRPRPNVNGDRWGPGYIGSPNLGSYPYGFDFLLYEFWSYLNYRADPLTQREERWRPNKEFVRAGGAPGLRETGEKFSFGLPYQIAASGKPAVLVVPMLDTNVGLGSFKHAEIVKDTLTAIQDHVFKTWGDVAPPARLGSTALAGFSFAVDFVREFLTDNAKHDFVRNTLQEVYLFDPSAAKSAADRSIQAAVKWGGGRQNPSGKAIRVYSQGRPSAMATLLGQRPPDGPFSEVSKLTDRWSAASLPEDLWYDAQRRGRNEATLAVLKTARASPETGTGLTPRQSREQLAEQDAYYRANVLPTKAGFNHVVHLMMAAMLLTDALRRSKLT